MFTLDVECHLVFTHQRTVQGKCQGPPAGRTPELLGYLLIHSLQPFLEHISHAISNVIVMGGPNILESGVAEAEGETKVEPFTTQGVDRSFHDSN